MKRLMLASLMSLFLSACSGGEGSGGPTRPEEPWVSPKADVAILATALAGDVPAAAVCPEGSTPDEPGPADQARPLGRGLRPMAFDRQSGQIVLLEDLPGGAQTWTFDVCTNTWRRMDPGPRPISVRSLVYDADSDLTVSFGRDGAVWAYDVEADSWTKAEGPSFDTPQPVYDPVSGLVVMRDGWTGLMYAIDVETGAWTEVPQGQLVPPTTHGPMHGQVFAYDVSVDRMVLFVEGHGCCPTTWLFDPRVGKWTQEDVATPTISFPMGDLASGGEVAFDEAGGQTIIDSGGERHSFDASAPRWDTEPIGMHRVFEHWLVYDSLNERVVLHSGESWLHGRWIHLGNVLAFDRSSGEWIELVPALEG